MTINKQVATDNVLKEFGFFSQAYNTIYQNPLFIQDGNEIDKVNNIHLPTK
jgi:hypothetical protein